jgi:hypothetical protein
MSVNAALGVRWANPQFLAYRCGGTGVGSSTLEYGGVVHAEPDDRRNP